MEVEANLFHLCRKFLSLDEFRINAMNFSNNFIPKNFTSSLNSPSNNLIPPPTNIINTFNQNNNVNNQNSQEKRLNINNYYYIGNYIYNQYNRIPGYNEDYNNPNKPRTITVGCTDPDNRRTYPWGEEDKQIKVVVEGMPALGTPDADD